MAGHSRLKDGVASAPLCPGHPRPLSRNEASQTWMARTSPGMTSISIQLFPLQIALSEVHSSAVNSGGPLGGRSSWLMRARRSSVSGWPARNDRLLSACFPVTRNINSPIGFGERPSRCITSIENVSAFCSASRE